MTIKKTGADQKKSGMVSLAEEAQSRRRGTKDTLRHTRRVRFRFGKKWRERIFIRVNNREESEAGA